MATTAIQGGAQPTQRIGSDEKKKVDWKEVGISSFKDFQQDDVQGMAGESAFHILLSLFPLAIFGAAMSGILNLAFPQLDLFNKIIVGVLSGLPPAAAEAIQGPLTEVLAGQNQSRGIFSIIGIVGALWSGTAAVGTIIKALNRAYDVEETRSFIQRKGLEIGLTLFLGLVLVVAFASVAFGGPLIDAIGDRFNFGGVGRFVTATIRWVLVVLFVVIALSVLYWIGPNMKQKFQWNSAGAIFSAVFMLVFIALFGVYVSQFGGAGSYEKTYGTLGGIIVLLLVFNYTSMIVMFGGELNSELAKRYDEKVVADLATNPAKDKGETIYAEKDADKKPEHRESDLKGAQARGNAYAGTSATTRNAAAKGHETPESINAAVSDDDATSLPVTSPAAKAKLANYATGKRETPATEAPPRDPAYRMYPGENRRPGTTLLDGPPPKRSGLIGVGILAAGAIGMAVRGLRGGK